MSEQISHNNQSKIAIINDITGFGRCSMTVMLPIISAMGIQCCPLPTAILSNHTGYDSFFIDDYTSKMDVYMHEWEKLGLRFEGICTGYLGSREQISIIASFLERFRTDHTVLVVDPVMGDNGKPYQTYSRELCSEMRHLAAVADLLTPNVTEACILTGTPYKESWNEAELEAMTSALISHGTHRVVITGIRYGEDVANFCHERNKAPQLLISRMVGPTRCGTGDIFCAILAADAIQGVPLSDSVQKAAWFIQICMQRSIEYGIPNSDGVCFEEFLYLLHRK
jgi:pyridoxine kinase